ncbi:MAG: apolipoprotein N-acyltransferase, partial [Rhodobacteraceae bacterium]|nr:apolipoprotein N-acyltransferase [Paracoccaceae bacterium]
STGDAPPFLLLICYEAIFPQHASVDGARADWIVQVTNDAWFGKFSGPYQHLAQARVRAIEQGLPLARSANTGVSAMVDPFGRVIEAIPLGEMGVIDVSLPAPLPETFYSRSGDWPIAGILLLLTLLQLLPVKRRRS